MISIAMAYYNRRKHLINTLNSITKSEYKKIEVIIVDDGSDDEHRIEDLQEQFDFLTVIRIDKKDKKHINPCVPFNIALGKTKGDIVILQNPECFHYDDVLTHVAENIKPNNYLAFGVVNKDLSDVMAGIDWNNNFQFEKVSKLPAIQVNSNEGNHWYCHSQYRKDALNFCTAIMRDDLIELNGFDERYANGVERDDVEFLFRIRRKGMNIIHVDNVVVIHQSHSPFNYTQSNAQKLRIANHNLFSKTTACENIVKANPNKEVIKSIDPMMNFTHLIVTRVNIRWLEHSKDNEWLKNRIELLNKTLRPSLEAQTNQNFKFITLWGYEPEGGISNEIQINFGESNVSGVHKKLVEVLPDYVDEKNVLVTRIDSDNALAEDFVEIIQNNVVDNVLPYYYDISKMHMYHLKSKNKRTWDATKTSGFISVMEKVEDFECIPYRYNHGLIGDKISGRKIDELGALLNIHDNNVSAKLLGVRSDFNLEKYNLKL